MSTLPPDRVRRSAAAFEEWETFIRLQRPSSAAKTWNIALPNGTYPVMVVSGDATSRNHTNIRAVGCILRCAAWVFQARQKSQRQPDTFPFPSEEIYFPIQQRQNECARPALFDTSGTPP